MARTIETKLEFSLFHVNEISKLSRKIPELHNLKTKVSPTHSLS